MTEIEQKLIDLPKKKIVITENVEEADLITHNGTFHSDEVFSTVFLLKLASSYSLEEPLIQVGDIVFEKSKQYLKLCRTSNIIGDIKGIVYDVGHGKFDHHQPGGNGERENGIKYSSFGLVWKQFGKQFLKNLNIENIDDIWKMIDNKLVQNIDAVDNGQLAKLSQFDFDIITLPNLITMYNSNWDDETSNQDECFIKAVEFASTIFDRFIISAVSKIKAKSKVLEAIERSENQILILDRFMPWKEFLLETDNDKAKNILFVVFPSNRGGYDIYSVPKELGSFESRKLFPESWAGLTNEELQKISGIETATFCHTNRFICVTKTKEDAIKLAEKTIGDRP